MGQTLTNGIYLPDEGERNSYSGLEANWRTLDALILTINGKAAPNVANTWTAAQTFTAGIAGDLTGNVTGDLTGTASRAIADEDGTSIKTGYGKLAGSQTWTGTNSFHNLNPETNSTYSLGTSSLKWSNIYGDNFYSTNHYTIVAYTRNASDQPTVTAFIREFKVDSADGKSFSRYATTVDKTYTSMQLIATMYDSNGDVDNEMRVRMQVSASEKIFIPGTNGDVKLGTSSNRWSAVYADSYYYGTTAFTDKFVTTNTSQTISGAKTFSSTITTKTNVDRTVAPVSDTPYGTITCRDKNNSAMFRMQGTIKTDLSNVWDMMMVAPNSSYITFFKYTISSSSTDRELRLKVTSVVPDDNSTADFGTSTNKWKTLNGINPGALSLPDFTSETGVSLSAGANTYTPVLSGWLSISTTGDISVVCGNFCHKATDMISVPVIAGKTYTVTMPSAATGYFYPCLGNV